MPETLAAALAVPGLVWVFAAVLAAGLVYGFAGFGAALIFIPVGVRILPPEDAIAAFAIAAWASAATMLPRLWPQADKRATAWMIAAAAATLPVGVLVLTRAPTVPLRWAICALVAATLLAVMTGWRARIGGGPGPRVAVGAGAGLIGGATGLLGPVVILLNLASGDDAARMRANLSSFLTVTSLAFPLVIWAQGALTAQAVWIGLLLLPVYGLGTAAGQALFRPGAERL